MVGVVFAARHATYLTKGHQHALQAFQVQSASFPCADDFAVASERLAVNGDGEPAVGLVHEERVPNQLQTPSVLIRKKKGKSGVVAYLDELTDADEATIELGVPCVVVGGGDSCCCA